MTNIPYLDEVWNLTRGCTKVSAGCKNCYAERIGQRFLEVKAFDVDCPITLANDDLIQKPLHWRKARRIGVCFMSDLFHEKVPDVFINQVMALIWRTGIPGCWTPRGNKWDPEDCPEEYRRVLPNHTYLILTKRPERMREYFADPERGEKIANVENDGPWDWETSLEEDGQWPIPNVWLGVSVEDQQAADERIPLLLETPAAHRWASAEPLLGAVDLHPGNWIAPLGGGPRVNLLHPEIAITRPTLDWVVVGGESGPHARAMNIDWLNNVGSQCESSGVLVYVKQDSGPRPGMQGRIPDALWAVKQLPGGWA